MTTTDMDQIAPPAEEASLPAKSYLSPMVPPRVRRISAFTPLFQSRERRWWTIALTATLLISALGIGLLYADDTSNQAAIRSLQLKNESLTGRSQILQDQLNTTQTNLTATLGELATTKAELEHPTLGVWNVPMTIHGPTEYLSATVPDTFIYHLHLKSTGPMNISILSTTQFRDAILCVYNGESNTNWCMHHKGAAWGSLGVTSVDHDFELAAGCAAYLAVITAPAQVTVTPNVSVTYNPATSATGACA
jgi:hypothetical protein